MPENNKEDIVIVNSAKGLYTDCSPIDQPKGTYRFALNAIEETIDGNESKLSNEPSSYTATNFPVGYTLIGDVYLGDDSSGVILCNNIDKKINIGIITKNNIYNSIVDTGVLNMPITHQCDIKFRIRRGNERVIYWVNAYNKPRTFNFDRIQNFYNSTYKNYIKLGGNPNTYVGEKWDDSSFDLIKSYSVVPTFDNVEVLESGNILSGSYNFAIQLIDEDLNPTEWITTSNTVNIFNDSTSNPFDRIRGSRNTTTSAQTFPRSNKAIKLTINNIDSSFPFYRLAIIMANGSTGEPNNVLLSDLFPRTESVFTYTGNDSNLAKGSLEEILIEKEVIFAPKHIEQLENRLILAHVKGKGINWCEFQKFASKINTDLATKSVIINNVNSDANIKNVKSTFLFRGYMPGEVYSFGIVYLFNDGYISPVCHIPGKNINNTTSLMKYHELNTDYLDIHNCSADNYWSLDATGNALVGNPIRHHRFPFRKEISKTLVDTTTSSTPLTKYKLTFTITLDNTYTPSPNTYPVDINGLPLLIDYGFEYLINGAASNSLFTGQLTKADVDSVKVITVYNDVLPLDFVSGTSYLDLDPTSDLAVTYQISGNKRFVITPTYASYVVSSSINNSTSEILGIEFSNIEKPHPDVVGFYIVRNDRKDDDKIVVDTAIVGIMTEYQQFKSFGLLTPKQFYNTQMCAWPSLNRIPNATLQFHNRAAYFFSPSHQYLQTKSNFDSIEIEGKYTQSSVNMPTSCDDYLKGIYIQDVQAGTSFNPDVNKGKDEDGFDLIVGYRNTNVTFSLDNAITFPVKDKILYLNAASYQNYNSNTYYNTSVDNKIGMFLTQTDIDLTKLRDSGTNTNTLLYGALVKTNLSSYSNFINRPYYKEHNNPILFGNNNIVNGVEVYNGDVQISAFNFISSVYYDAVMAKREKKSKLFAIIAGALLLVVGIATAVFGVGLGLTAAAVGVLSAAAVSYGVSLAVSGIKFEQYKAMLDSDYDRGLRETVTDGGVFETIGKDVGTGDDTFRWFSDRVSNLYMESEMPFGLRSGLTTGVTDFIDAPAPYDESIFRNYLVEKFTTVDGNQSSGRLYKGYAGAEVYDMNLDYMRRNKEKSFIHLPLEYDCCSDVKEEYPLRRWFSVQSFQEEKTDNYRTFLPNNYSDMEGEHGEITDLFRQGNVLYVHTKESLWLQPANIQERVTNEIVSFIGTGDFLSVPPRKIVDDTLGSVGCQHKWATIKTGKGVVSVNEIESAIHISSGNQAVAISERGNKNWFKENLRSFLSKQFYDVLGINYPYDNNPANPWGIGYIAVYDAEFNRIIITKKDYLYLGNLNLIIANFDITVDYPNGSIFIDENGWHVITATNFSNPVLVNYSDWTEKQTTSISPVVVGNPTVSSKLRLTYGQTWMANGQIWYTADEYVDIPGFVSGIIPPEPAQVEDYIPIETQSSCANETILITIPNDPLILQ